MFIDISTYVGHWPFRNLENNTLEGLDKLAQDNEITHMAVANLNGFFYKDANFANLELLEWLKLRVAVGFGVGVAVGLGVGVTSGAM